MGINRDILWLVCDGIIIIKNRISLKEQHTGVFQTEEASPWCSFCFLVIMVKLKLNPVTASQRRLWCD